MPDAITVCSPEGYRKGTASDEAGGEIQPTHYQLLNTPGAFAAWRRRREARRGHCPESAGDVSLKSTGIVHPYREKEAAAGHWLQR